MFNINIYQDQARKPQEPKIQNINTLQLEEIRNDPRNHVLQKAAEIRESGPWRRAEDHEIDRRRREGTGAFSPVQKEPSAAAAASVEPRS